MLDENLTQTERIARLNDRARSGFDPSAQILFTRGCPDAFAAATRQPDCSRRRSLLPPSEGTGSTKMPGASGTLAD